MSTATPTSRSALLARARTIGTFGATTVLSGGVSVLSIPLIVLFTNSSAWGSVALGQAIGSSVGVLAMFGWGITGPAEIAMMDARRHSAAYWDSVIARLTLFVPALIVTVAVTWVLVPSEQLASSVCGAAMAFGGLSGTWYLVGRKRPDRLFLFDTLPRVAGTLVGIGALALTGSLIVFGLLQLAGSFLAFALVTRWALPGLKRPEGAARGIRAVLKVIAGQRHGVAVAVAVASYYPIVLALVASFTPGFLPLYALIEKVLRFATMAMQPVFQFFQATVPAQRGLELGRAVKRSLVAVTVVALLCWAGFAILLPVASGILTAGEVAVPLLVAVNLGAYMGGVVLINYMTSVALIAVDRVRQVSRGSIVGSAIGLIAILALALGGDGKDISWGFVLTEVLVLAYQFVILARALPERIAATMTPVEVTL